MRKIRRQFKRDFIISVLTDKDGNETREMKTNAFLVKSVKVPLIPGFRDILSRFKVCFGYEKDNAYLEEKW